MPRGYNGSLPEIKERLQKCDFCWRIVAALSGQKKLDGAERDRKTRPGRPTSCTHIHISVSDIWIKVSGKLWSWSLRRRSCFYASAAVTAVDRAGVFLGHLSVSTSSRGNFFKYATNIRLDSVMFLQKTFWSLLRTRRNWLILQWWN